MRHFEFVESLVHAGAFRGDITPGLPWPRGMSRDRIIKTLELLRFELASRLDSEMRVRWFAVPAAERLCRICGKPRPFGYASTCGHSSCQEQDFLRHQSCGTYKQHQRAARRRVGAGAGQ